VIGRSLLFLLALCLLDTATSAYLFHHELALEANSLVRPYVDAGAGAFVAFKLFTFVPALALLELLRRRRPRTITPIIRAGGAGYIMLYLMGMLAQIG
jgi:hypothetical protein